MPHAKIILTIPQSGERVDRALLRSLQQDHPALSRTLLKTLFREKRVRFNETPLPASRVLEAGAHEITILDWDPRTLLDLRAPPSLRGCFLPIVYEDEDLLVLHKLSGIPSIPHASNETETAVGAALARIPELADVGRGGLEPGILHRLDTGTSGLIVFAKTDAEYERLHAAWQERRVRKIYRALAQGTAELPTTPMTLTVPLAHDARSDKKMIALTPELSPNRAKIRGKPLSAVTHLVNARYSADRPLREEARQNPMADFEIEIETGVMHQIRCHLAMIGWPILGDPVYRGAPSSRLWLHAWKLRLPLRKGAELLLEAQLPPEWL